MAELDLEAEVRKPVRTVREPPRWFRALLRQAFMLALRERKHRETAAWKLFVLTPRMLLQATQETGKAGKNIFMERYRRFRAGDWTGLLRDSAATQRHQHAGDSHSAEDKKLAEASGKVRMREVRRARLHLTSSGLAPGTPATLAQLRDPARRPAALSEALPPEATSYRPARSVNLEWASLANALRSAGRGSAADLAGARYEHYRVLMEEKETWAEFADLIQDFVRAKVPDEVMQGLRMGRMTALNKKDGNVRGIVAGSIIRRLGCRAIAQQFSDAFMITTSPYQFALQAKAGTDALARAVHLLTEEDQERVVISLDGIGAYDHVKRAAFMRKLYGTERLRALLPLVTALYGTESRFVWRDDEGVDHIVTQAEGGEQGDPLMPALFSLAQHDGLVQAAQQLPSATIFAFLDDIYVVEEKTKAHAAFRTVAAAVEAHAGVRTHHGKLQAWSRAGGTDPTWYRWAGQGSVDSGPARTS